jgi:hypothetical protein
MRPISNDLDSPSILLWSPIQDDVFERSARDANEEVDADADADASADADADAAADADADADAEADADADASTQQDIPPAADAADVADAIDIAPPASRTILTGRFVPSVLVMRIGGSLYFANVAYVRDAIMANLKAFSTKPALAPVR